MKAVMLAANKPVDIKAINYPKLVSGKLDGVRGIVQEGKLVSRSLKDSLNRYVVSRLSNPLFEGLDGELCIRGPKWQDFDSNQSAFMTQTGQPEFDFWVFDDMSLADETANARASSLQKRVQKLNDLGHTYIKYCPQHTACKPGDVMKLYTEYRAKGYEGLILKEPLHKYKHGRSTLKQETLLKLKPREDSEAVIIGFEPVMHNMDAGNSKCKENLVEGDRVGVILATWNGRTIRIGTGFDHNQAAEWLANPAKYIGKTFTFSYMQLTKAGEPRHGSFKGFRSLGDL